MGSTISKTPRKLPKTFPSWAGARTPLPAEQPQFRASEVKDEDIRKDSSDPHFLVNLSRLGPVRMNYPMKTIRPAAMAETNKMFESRVQSEAEAASAKSVPNRLHAAALSELLDRRKSAKTREEVSALAKEYDVDAARLEGLARFVSSPSVDGNAASRMVDGEGIGMKAVWIEPRLQT